MRLAKRWYERERWAYLADRRIADAYAVWINEVPWHLYGTFTFAWRVSDQHANNIFGAFIDRIEQFLQCDVGYVRGDEKRFSGCGKPACARHYHVLLICTAPLTPEFVEELWMSMAGRRSDGAGAVVTPYAPGPDPKSRLKGPSYVMKFINQVDGDWAMSKMHLFKPPPGEEKVRSRMRRHLRRHPDLEQYRQSQDSRDVPGGDGTPDELSETRPAGNTSCN